MNLLELLCGSASPSPLWVPLKSQKWSLLLACLFCTSFQSSIFYVLSVVLRTLFTLSHLILKTISLKVGSAVLHIADKKTKLEKESGFLLLYG